MGTGEGVVDDDGVVRIGSVVFALIRPTEGHDAAFNHWYERDHFYTAGLAAPGVFSAARFIEPTDRLHLALYFVLPGHDDARVAFATEQVTLAADEDRLFTDREHLHTWSYRIEDTIVRAGGVAPALALDRRYPAVSVGWCDPGIEEPAAPVVLTMRTVAPVMPSAWDSGVDASVRRMIVAFHDDDTPDPFAGRPGVHWSARFVAAVVGTDTHVTG